MNRGQSPYFSQIPGSEKRAKSRSSDAWLALWTTPTMSAALVLSKLELRLDIVPFDDLFSRFAADAALSRDFSAVYVDAES